MTGSAVCSGVGSVDSVTSGDALGSDEDSPGAVALGLSSISTPTWPAAVRQDQARHQAHPSPKHDPVWLTDPVAVVRHT